MDTYKTPRYESIQSRVVHLAEVVETRGVLDSQMTNSKNGFVVYEHSNGDFTDETSGYSSLHHVGEVRRFFPKRSTLLFCHNESSERRYIKRNYCVRRFNVTPLK